MNNNINNSNNYMNDIIIKYCKELSGILGKGYAECVYQEALCVNLRNANIEYSKESIIPILYKNINIGNVRSDIIINNKLKSDNIIIECKAIDGNLKINHVPQLICYMRLMNINHGILVNFNQHPGKTLLEYITVNKCDENTLEVVLDNTKYLLDWFGVII